MCLIDLRWFCVSFSITLKLWLISDWFSVFFSPQRFSFCNVVMTYISSGVFLYMYVCVCVRAQLRFFAVQFPCVLYSSIRAFRKGSKDKQTKIVDCCHKSVCITVYLLLLFAVMLTVQQAKLVYVATVMHFKFKTLNLIFLSLSLC